MECEGSVGHVGSVRVGQCAGMIGWMTPSLDEASRGYTKWGPGICVGRARARAKAVPYVDLRPFLRSVTLVSVAALGPPARAQ